MSIVVVRQTSDNRVLAAFASASDAQEWATAAGAGHDRVALTDQQQGDETANTLLGKVVSDAGVVSAYVLAGAALRGYRRERCYSLIEEAIYSIPGLAAKEDEAASTVIHKFLRACYAAATLDANMDDTTKFNEVEDACKGGALGTVGLFRVMVTDTSTRTDWGSDLSDSVTLLWAPDAAGAPQEKTAVLQSDWATNDAYHAVRVLGR